jgi:hypothetical protein
MKKELLEPVGKVADLKMDNIILEGNRIKYKKRAATAANNMNIDKYKGKSCLF